MILVSPVKEYQRSMLEFILEPWHLIVLFLASHVNREQQRIIEYLRVENEVLREKLGKKRILLNDDQRRRLAMKGKVLGRKLLRGLGSMVTPDTIFYLTGLNQWITIACYVL
jgi:putative transposase